MTLHVTILGIDGSGKTTLTSALPSILAGEMSITAGSSGESFQVVGPEEDHLAPKFLPEGMPVSGRLSIWLKRKAKEHVDNRKLYPFFKLPQMIAQDHATYRLSQRYEVQIIFSDGNALLSPMGRAANYLRAASDPANIHRPVPTEEDFAAVYRYILDGVPVPSESQRRLPSLSRGRLIYRLSRWFGIRGIWLPNLLIFIDLSPQTALTRIARRSKVDIHENLADLAQAREMYLKTLEAFRRYSGSQTAHCIHMDTLTPGETAQRIVDLVRPLIQARRNQNVEDRPLGTSREQLTGGGAWKKILTYRYLVRYLLAKGFRGAWREPTFAFSKLGRLLLKEGYSAAVMRAIYDQEEKDHGFLDRIFLEYPLHRAVYDRLQILTRKIEPLLEKRLKSGSNVSIFTGPSGFAYDLFRPLESIAQAAPQYLQNLVVTAADLDPHGYLETALTSHAEKLGIRLRFFRGDITQNQMRSRFEEAGPFDVSLFVGLSSWIPKPLMLDHFRWLRRHLRADGIFITDSFTPDAFALSGRYAGYKANYYSPEVFRVMLDYCEFDGMKAQVESGRDRINHVYLVYLRHGA